ncbi:MAG: alpha/beta hydrolase [Bacteroidota bacterium]
MQKTLVRIASQIAPGMMANLAYKTLTHPQIRKLRDHEEQILDQAERKRISVLDSEIQTYTWGEGPDSVLMVHGWEGQAGNFSDLVDFLVKKGMKVYAFDGPSHGRSSQGATSLFEFAEVVAQMMRTFPSRNLISHSFGGVASTLALSTNPDISYDKYLLFTTPDKFRERIQDVSDQVGVTDKVIFRLIKRLETETGVNVNDQNVSDFVKKIQIEQALILHDVADKVIPLERSENVVRNWKNASLETVTGTGHFRILRSEKMWERAWEFLRS